MVRGRLRGWDSFLGTAEDLVQLALVEVGESWDTAASVLSKDLDHARDEELLLPVALGFPVIGLAHSDEEAIIPCPLTKVGRDIGAGVGLDGGEIIQVPSLAYRKSAIHILFCLVYTHPTGLPDGDDDDTGLLGLGVSRLGRRGGRGIRRKLEDSKMCDIGLQDWRWNVSWIQDCAALGRGNAPEPSSSLLLKQLSMMRRFSSSNRSARLMAMPPDDDMASNCHASDLEIYEKLS